MAAPLDSDDEWYESEPSTRKQMVAEIQRIRRRTAVRPVPVILLAALLTAGILYKLATKKKIVEAEVVLLLSEGETDRRETGLPVNELREYVLNRLLPKARLAEIIERHDLFHLRKKLGIDYAIEELKSQMEIAIWKNSFMYQEDPGGRSARIGITVGDTDPDRALQLARDLAHVAIDTATEQRQEMADELAKELARTREILSRRSAEIAQQVSEKQVKLDDATRLHKDQIAQSIQLELDQLKKESKQVATELATVAGAGSRDAAADQLTASGQDMTLSIVDERRPERPASHLFELILIGVVVGLCALLGSALIVGAFDSRVHDTDDVERLGLPVLGHVPGFPGDQVGSLAARGAVRGRVPSFLRWRSRR